MEKDLISWKNVLEKYNINNDSLRELCNDGLQVYDANGNKIYATSQLEYERIEPPNISWGRIFFDPEQDELILEQNYYDEEALFIKIFPETGDFIIVRKDVNLTLYDQNIFAHLMNIKFPQNINQDFFKKAHKAGDESYLPPETVNGEVYQPKLYTNQKNWDSNIKIRTSIVTETPLYKIKYDKIIIPYTLKQIYSGSTKELKLELILSDNNNYNFFDLSQKLKKKRTRTELTIYSKDTSNEQKKENYFSRLHDKEIETTNTFLRPLLIGFDGSIHYVPSIAHLSENFSNFIENIAEETPESFYWKYGLLGYSSYLPINYIIPEETNSEEKIFHFSLLFSPLSKNSFSYDENKWKEIESIFFFSITDLEQWNISLKPFNKQEKLIKILRDKLDCVTSKIDKRALNVAIAKYSEEIKHEAIYDKFFSKDTSDKYNKLKPIHDAILRAQKLCSEEFKDSSNGIKKWKEYYKNPSAYIDRNITFLK